MNIGERGVFFFTEGLTASEVVDAAVRLEDLGYGAVWIPEAVGREPFATAAMILSHTKKLVVATGIVNIYWREPMVCAMGQQTLTELSDGRFILGLGVSHQLLVERTGLTYQKPLGAMRTYIERIRQAHSGVSLRKNLIAEGFDSGRPDAETDLSTGPIIVAALGPKMTALAGEIADGAMPANTIPKHTEESRAILGDGPLLCPMQRVFLSDDEEKSRAAGRALIEFYLALPNYRSSLLRMGFSEGDLEGGGSDHLVDSLLAWGSPDHLEQSIQAHLDAGANHVCLFPISPHRLSELCWNALEAFAPS